MNPPPVYKPDNSLRHPSPAQAKMVQPKIQPVAAGAPQLRAVNQAAVQRVSQPASFPQPVARVIPHVNKTAPVFPPVVKSAVPVHAIQPHALTANVSLIQQRPAVQRSLVQRSFVQAKPIVQQKPVAQVFSRPMAHLSRGTAHNLIRVPGTIQRNSLPVSYFGARIAPANLNRIQHGIAPRAMVIQRMQTEESWGSWAGEKVKSFGSLLISHPIPKTFSALINVADQIITAVAVSLQTTGVAVAGSVTKLIQSVNSAAKLAAQYSEAAEDSRERARLKAQCIVECTNILISIVTLILATQGQLAASVWTNVITTLLAKTSGEIYEVYRSWMEYRSDQASMPLLT